LSLPLPSLPNTIFNLAFIGFLFWVFYKKQAQLSPLKKYFFPALLLKLVAGITIGLVYQWYASLGKGADTIGLFWDGVYMNNLAWETPLRYLDFLFFSNWELDQDIFQHFNIKNPRGVIFSKFISIFNFFTFNNHWLTGLYFSSLSFLGLWFCANTLVSIWKKTKWAVIISFFYLPSVVFWSSGIMKESLLMACVGIFVSLFLIQIEKYKSYQLNAFLDIKLFPHKKNIQGLSLDRPPESIYKTNTLSAFKLFIILILTYIILQLKYYYLAVLLPTVLSLAIVKLSKYQWVLKHQTLSFFLIFSLTLLIASNLHPNLNLDFVLKAIVKNNLIMMERTDDLNNLIHFQNLSPDFSSLLQNLPIAFWEGLARPYLWEEGHWFKKMASLETTTLMLLILYNLFSIRKIKIQQEWKVYLISCLTYILLLEVLLTLAAPNLGNLTRYKVGYLPFLVYILLSNLCFLSLKSK